MNIEDKHVIAAAKEFLRLKELDRKHHSKWGFRKPSPYSGRIENAFAVCARVGALCLVRRMAIQKGVL